MTERNSLYNIYITGKEGCFCGFGVFSLLIFCLFFQSAVLDQFASHQGEAKETVFMEPFDQIPPDFGAEESNELRLRAEKAISDCVQPGMAQIARCISEEYLPNCRPNIGASSLPDGEKFYDQVKVPKVI